MAGNPFPVSGPPRGVDTIRKLDSHLRHNVPPQRGSGAVILNVYRLVLISAGMPLRVLLWKHVPEDAPKVMFHDQVGPSPNA